MNNAEAKIRRATKAIKGQNGGARPGAGRPPGSLEVKTRTLIEVKNRIAQKADEILNAELIEALGANVVLKLDPESLEYKQVTDPKEITAFINAHKGANGRVNEAFYVIAAKPGNYKSRQYLMDRAFGKPAQSVSVTTEVDERVKILREVALALTANPNLSLDEAQSLILTLIEDNGYDKQVPEFAEIRTKLLGDGKAID